METPTLAEPGSREVLTGVAGEVAEKRSSSQAGSRTTMVEVVDVEVRNSISAHRQ
jgi:hypothetical protein